MLIYDVGITLMPDSHVKYSYEGRQNNFVRISFTMFKIVIMLI